MTVLTFRDEFSFLSNFFPCNVDYEGITYPSSEHAFQAAKTNNLEQRLLILKADTPGKAKRIGRRVDLRPDWEICKLDIMRTILRQKFTQNTELALLLSNLRGVHLEEGNYWKDTFWGICPVGSGIGQNHLGKILMELATTLN